MKPLYIILIILFTACSNESRDRTFTLNAGDNDLDNTPVYVTFEGERLSDGTAVCLHSEGSVLPGQIERISESEQRIWLKANQRAGKSAEYMIRSGEECYDLVYTWERQGEESSLLSFGNQPVLQYEHPVYDPDDVERTKKPFHHLFDPAGDQLITKGPGGLYTHHRGIFFGYNHVYTNDRRIDIWHARDGERSEHIEVLKEFTGPVMGGHIVKIHWKDHDGEPFLEETREIRLFKQSEEEILVDFISTLEATAGPVVLDGDRQHAGVQFRAAQYVADNPDQTNFIRPGHLSHIEPDEEIEGPDMMDLPWNAMRFVVEGRPYTVAYLSHPSNPDNAEMSERLYGRFGEFFPYEVTSDNPLQVQYRFIVKAGTLSPDEIDHYHALYADNQVAQVH